MITNNTFSIEQTTGVITAGSDTITKSNDLVGIALTLKTSTVNTTAATLAQAALSARLTVGTYSIEQSDYFIESGVAYLEFVLTEAAQKRIAYDDACSIDFVISEKTGPRRTYSYTGGTLYASTGGGGGTGDVTASTAFGTDNRLIRSDGTGKGVQSTGVTCDDSNNVTGVGSIQAGSASVGGIDLTSGAIALNKNLTADNTCSGVTISGTNGGETIAQWETVYFSAADNEWMKADANVAGKFPAQGITTAATTNGTSATVLTTGIIRNDAWNWTVGGKIYLSTTAGGLTQTAPSTSGDCVQPVGYALTADIAFFNFTPAYVEVA